MASNRGFNRLDRNSFGLILNKLGHRNKVSLATVTTAHRRNALASAAHDRTTAATAARRAMEAAARRTAKMLYQAAARWRKEPLAPNGFSGIPEINARFFIDRYITGEVWLKKNILELDFHDNRSEFISARVKMYLKMVNGVVTIRNMRVQATPQMNARTGVAMIKAIVRGALKYYRQNPVKAW